MKTPKEQVYREAICDTLRNICNKSENGELGLANVIDELKIVLSKAQEYMSEEIDERSGWSLEDIKTFKKELLEDREQAQGDYGLSEEEVEYIINYKI